MERTLDHHLDRIRQSLLRMGGLVEEMIAESQRALVNRDLKAAEHVIDTDNEVDNLEKEIDELCHTALARHQPTAVDLRFISAAMKINNDLERMGDSAVNIAEAAQVLINEPPLKPYIDIPRLSELAQKMVRQALDAFVQGNVSLAQEICARDDEVDGLYKQIFRELVTYMIEDPKTVNRALHLLLVARNLERIADHATNVAEDVIYYVDGRDVRHLSS